ncbi:MAG: Fe2+/Zn2+ uptake regulation protein [Candidatus Berkelbacteria bacterium Licking1014_96]|uniref:Fe2+/Zn2+ uptake regulation protein n=1 Tax=Candidatus Berkelbacteria bacterium Licking1014_96 TaxID=2017149 RepID=A0A554LF04_9BACT|nr:MAG: Fe2+/Zn2+ uptake regulation protein [Candidatus Berkelbacteria bacterium Licking1014_96]
MNLRTEEQKNTGRIKPSSRMTNQRLEIISFLQSSSEHPTAERIYFEVRKKLPKISRGTIYRNLEILEKKDLVKRFNFGEKRDRFDAERSDHHHFFCQRCRRVIDVILPDAYQLKERTENSEQVKVENFGIMFKGKCNICRTN